MRLENVTGWFEEKIQVILKMILENVTGWFEEKNSQDGSEWLVQSKNSAVTLKSNHHYGWYRTVAQKANLIIILLP